MGEHVNHHLGNQPIQSNKYQHVLAPSSRVGLPLCVKDWSDKICAQLLLEPPLPNEPHTERESAKVVSFNIVTGTMNIWRDDRPSLFFCFFFGVWMFLIFQECFNDIMQRKRASWLC